VTLSGVISFYNVGEGAAPAAAAKRHAPRPVNRPKSEGSAPALKKAAGDDSEWNEF